MAHHSSTHTYGTHSAAHASHHQSTMVPLSPTIGHLTPHPPSSIPPLLPLSPSLSPSLVTVSHLSSIPSVSSSVIPIVTASPIIASSSSSSSSSSSGSSNGSEWKVGDVIDAHDFQKQWFQGEVRRVRHVAGGMAEYFVQFEGYAPKWNEWVRHDHTAICGTKSEASSTRYMSYEDDHHSSAHINNDQYDKMRRWIESSPSKEIGGDLFGTWDIAGQPIISYVLGPGPKAQGGAVSFYQDEEYLEANGNALAAIGLEHIGEWHSHHSLNLPTPSGGDCRTVVGAMKDYNRDRFLLCIATVAWTLPKDASLPSSSSSSLSSPSIISAPLIGGTPGGMLPLTQRATVPIARAIPYVFVKGAHRYRKISWHMRDDASIHANFKLVDRVSRPVTVNATQWYATSDGKSSLAAIISECKIEFGDAKISRHISTHDLELSFVTFTLTFPSSFPRNMATVRRVAITGTTSNSSSTSATAVSHAHHSDAHHHSSSVAVRYRLVGGDDSITTAKFEVKPFIMATVAATIELGIASNGLL